MNLFDQLIQLNFFSIVAAMFLGFFLLANRRYEPALTKFFVPIFFFLLILIASDNLDYYMFDKVVTAWPHTFVAVIGYNMRMLILLRLVTIMDYNVKGDINRYLIVPVVIHFVVSLMAFTTKLVIWYDPADGHIHHGILGYTSHVMFLLFLTYGIHLAVLAYRKGTVAETILIILEEAICALATLIETNVATRGILVGVIALCVVFYYLYLHICTFYKDPLTGVLNRTSLYADLKKYEGRIVAVYSIDLNGLKAVNDNEGHDAGDRLIRTAAGKLQAATVPGSFLYRTGGDEFVILCINMGKHQIQQVTANLFAAQANGVDMAFGMHEFEESIKTTFRLADDAMYINKRNLKSYNLKA